MEAAHGRGLSEPDHKEQEDKETLFPMCCISIALDDWVWTKENRWNEDFFTAQQRTIAPALCSVSPCLISAGMKKQNHLSIKWGARMTKVPFQGHSGWQPIQLPSGLLIFYSLWLQTSWVWAALAMGRSMARICQMAFAYNFSTVPSRGEILWKPIDSSWYCVSQHSCSLEHAAMMLKPFMSRTLTQVLLTTSVLSM